MKDLKLTVRVRKPIQQVFDFTTNPDNTAKWIDSVVGEEADMFPPELGTTYRNWDASGKLNEYKVTQYESPKVFQLDATHQDYKVRYTYTPISENETELEYYEWSESDQLHAPFMQEILDKLKEVMESEELKSQLAKEGFPYIYKWHDEPDTQYPLHAHKGKVSMYVLGGSLTFCFGSEEVILNTGDRFDVPVGKEHTAKVGPEGCTFLVGEMIEDDS